MVIMVMRTKKSDDEEDNGYDRYNNDKYNMIINIHLLNNNNKREYQYTIRML